MTNMYVREQDGTIRQANSMTEWGEYFSDRESRRIAQDDIGEEISVSTVFLGMDHGFGGGGPPIVFETMVFGGVLDEYQWRYATEEEARANHNEIVEAIQMGEEDRFRDPRQEFYYENDEERPNERVGDLEESRNRFRRTRGGLVRHIRFHNK